MDQAERKDTAQHALVYVGIGVTVVVLLVLLWYAIDVFLLLFMGIFIAVLLRAPADWLAGRTGWSEGVTLGLVIFLLGALLGTGAFFFGRTVANQSWQLTQQLPKVVEKVRERLRQTEYGTQIARASEAPTPEASAQALGKVERGHDRDRVDVAAMLERQLVTREGLWAYFDTVRPSLFRFPAVDARTLEQSLERTIGPRPHDAA